MMKLKFLGTGTSTGVPVIGCNCEVCRSSDERDKRLRCSALLSVEGHNILIDCGPDFREQMLRIGSPDIEALLVTHSHYDHVGGVDDLRPYCYRHNLPVYCQENVATDLRNRVPYCFAENPYPGVPIFDVHCIDSKPFEVCGVEVIPLPVMHYRLEIFGYRVGNLAYITDCKTLPESTEALIQGVDTLVINALRWTEHMSHQSVEQALAIIERVKPRVAYLIHMADRIGLHAQVQKRLPDGVFLAYDNLEIKIL
jgi:phosphoribosyl 1,2-cyclic phosphate phosphodiesterase